MSDIALICTSPFSEMDSFKSITVPSLMWQTCQDFTFYYLDAFYSHNRQYFKELQNSVKFKIVHSPGLHATHYPHYYTWEQYNSAILLSQEPIFLRFGRFREYHPRVVEFVVSNLKPGMIFNFPFTSTQASFNWDEILYFDRSFGSNGGMIAMSRNDFIYQLNGNDEVGLHWIHPEDVEMYIRITNHGFEYIDWSPAIIRYPHDKDPENQSLVFDEPIPRSPYPRELLGYNTELKQRLTHHPDFEAFSYQGFDWFHNPKVNMLVPSDYNPYLDWIGDRKQSIIGINGLRIGRNLGKIDYHLTNTISERIQIIHDSFSDKDNYI